MKRNGHHRIEVADTFAAPGPGDGEGIAGLAIEDCHRTDTQSVATHGNPFAIGTDANCFDTAELIAPGRQRRVLALPGVLSSPPAACGQT